MTPKPHGQGRRGGDRDSGDHGHGDDHDRGAAVAPPKTSTPPRCAILVIHGIGQQQPFQPLDSFVNGLRATLKLERKSVDTTHFMHGRDEVFDHSVRVEATEPDSKQPSLCLDVYEFYWAPLTQGKASFAQIVRWLLTTGFTPVRRLAFNLPLLIQRAESRVKRFKDTPAGPAAQSMPVAPGATQGSQSETPVSVTRPRRAQATLAVIKYSWVLIEFLRELWRLVYVSLVAAALVGLALGLVSQSSAFAKRIPEALAPAFKIAVTWDSAATFAFALVAAVAALALALSIPEQVRNLVRLRKLEPMVFDEVGAVARRAYKKGSGILHKVIGGAWAGFVKLLDVATTRARWQIELRARRWLLPLSIACFALAASVAGWLSLPMPGCLYVICPEPVVYKLLAPLVKTDLLVVLLLLGIAFLLKRVLVDYLGDVALYTTADENSEFFATRAAIQKEATRRVRHLLRDGQYSSVAIAGHSLGSVIGYDAIGRLRTEAQLPRPPSARKTLDAMAKLVAKLPAPDDAEAKGLLDQLERAVGACGGAAGSSHQAATDPVTVDELAKLKTFITFGSPLNKVLYFFRTKINVYETIRSHIIWQMHGFRQQEILLTRDPSIQDNAVEVPDALHWINIYSPMDPVSGRLDLYYSNVIEHRHWYLVWGQCHMSYWHDPRVYREILATVQR